MSTAFSYLRFSSPEQAKGDSVRRQTEATADWCRRNGVPLDGSLSLRDEGVSAFKGKHRENPDVHAMAAFLQAVKTGRVPPDSYLVLENLDRLSREKIVPAVNLLTSILLAGVRVVQLQPVEQIFTAGADMASLMMAIVELSRGHSESQMKSERVGAAWARKRKEAPSRLVTRKVPGWFQRDQERKVILVEGKLVLDPEGVETVRRIFDLALEGKGVQAIARILNADGVPVMGRKVFRGRPVAWNETVVYHVLRSRATFGEYQPCKGRGSVRVPDGDPISDYFPAVIDRDTFLAAQAALKGRTKHGAGRRGKHVNLFSGLLVDARDGGSLTYKHLAKRPSAIIPVGAKQGRGSVWSSFPAAPLERAIRSRLVEVKAEDIQGTNGAARKVEALSGRFAELSKLLDAWTAKMDNPDTVDIVAAKLAELKTKRKVIADELAEAQREAANPLAESWGEFRTLAGLNPDDDTDELRVRIRAALRRSIDSVHCLFSGVGRTRLASVQVWFKGGAYRSYLVIHRGPIANGKTRAEGSTYVVSTAQPAGAEAGLPFDTEDLRDPDQAACVAGYLERLPRDVIDRLLATGHPLP